MFWSIHYQCIKDKKYQKSFFGEESADIHESQQTKSCTVLSLVHNNNLF